MCWRGLVCEHWESLCVCYLYCSAPTAPILKPMLLFHSREGSYYVAGSFLRRKLYADMNLLCWKKYSIEMLETVFSNWSCCCCGLPGSRGYTNDQFPSKCNRHLKHQFLSTFMLLPFQHPSPQHCPLSNLVCLLKQALCGLLIQNVRPVKKKSCHVVVVK